MRDGRLPILGPDQGVCVCVCVCNCVYVSAVKDCRPSRADLFPNLKAWMLQRPTKYHTHQLLELSMDSMHSRCILDMPAFHRSYSSWPDGLQMCHILPSSFPWTVLLSCLQPSCNPSGMHMSCTQGLPAVMQPDLRIGIAARALLALNHTP